MIEKPIGNTPRETTTEMDWHEEFDKYKYYFQYQHVSEKWLVEKDSRRGQETY